MHPTVPLLDVALATGLGLLVGFQREWTGDKAHIGGVRTFALIGLLGAIAGLLGAVGIGTGLLGLAAFLVAAWRPDAEAPQDQGRTTGLAAMVVFLVGALATTGQREVAVFAGALVTVLLYFKPEMHRVVERMQEKDLRGVIQLALIGLVILPVLPDRTFGPYDVLNPYKIWRMVVLIVGISLAAYASYRVAGARAGSVLGGVLGGLISSTATTVSYARQVRDQPASAPLAALVILIASTIVNARILVEIGTVAPAFLPHAAPPVGVLSAWMVALCGIMAWRARGQKALELDHDNPAQLQAALFFGGLYAVVLFLVAAVKAHFGDGALFGVAVVSGLTDVDAITLSTAEMVSADRLDPATGWRVVMVAALANLVFKAGAAASLGGRHLAVPIALLFGSTVAGGLALVMLWP